MDGVVLDPTVNASGGVIATDDSACDVVSARVKTAAPRGARTVAGVALVLLSALAFGSTPALASLAFTAHLNGLSLVAFRCLLASVVLALISTGLRESGLDRRTAVRLFGLGALLFGPQMVLYFAAIQRLDTSITVAVVYIYPAVVAAAVGVRLRRLPPALDLVLLVVAVVGVGAVALARAGSASSTAGVMLAVATAVIFAGYVIASDVVIREAPPIAAGGVVLAGAGFSALVAAAALGQLELPVSGPGWVLVGLHGVIIVPVGLAAYYAGLKRLGATRSSIVDTAQPAIAAVIGVLALGERLNLVQVVGMIAIVFAVLGLPLAAAGRARRKPGLVPDRDAP